MAKLSRHQFSLALLTLLLSTCRGSATEAIKTPSPIPPTSTPSLLRSEIPTATYTPAPTSTSVPSPTPDSRPQIIDRNNVKDLHVVSRLLLDQSGLQIQGASYSPNGRYLMVFGYYTHIYDAESYELLGKIPSNIGNIYYELAREKSIILEWQPLWSPDSHKVAFVTAGGFIEVWSTDGFNLLTKLEPQQGNLYSFDWSPDSEHIVASGDDNNLYIWDLLANEAPLQLEGHTAFVHALYWSPSGDQIASASMKPELFIWDVASRSVRHRISSLDKPVISMEWHPADARLAMSNGEQRYIIWNTIAGDPSLEFFVLHPDHFRSGNITWSGDGRLIAYFDDHQTIFVKNARSGDLLLNIYRAPGDDLSFSFDSRYLTKSEGIIYETTTGNKVPSPDDLIRSEGIAWSPIRNELARWNQDEIQIWNIDAGTLTMLINPEVGSVAAFRLSPDGEKIALLETSRGILVISGEHQYRYPITGLQDWDNQLEWIADSRQVAIPVPDGTIRIWNPFSGEENTLRSDGATVIAASPYEDLVIAGSWSGRVEVWDVDAPVYPDMLTEGNWYPIRALTSSAGGDSVAAIDGNGDFHLFSLEAGKRIKHQSLLDLERFDQLSFVSLEWIPKAQNLAIYAQIWRAAEREIDEETWILDVETMEAVCTIKTEWGGDLNASPMGDLLLVGSQVIDAETCEVLAELQLGRSEWLPDQSGIATFVGNIEYWALADPEPAFPEPTLPPQESQSCSGWWTGCGIHIYSDLGRDGEGGHSVYDAYDRETDNILLANTLVLGPDFTYLAYLDFGGIHEKFAGTFHPGPQEIVLEIPDDLNINGILRYTTTDLLVWKDLSDDTLTLHYGWSIPPWELP